jgi:hypothetical protein
MVLNENNRTTISKIYADSGIIKIYIEAFIKFIIITTVIIGYNNVEIVVWFSKFCSK